MNRTRCGALLQLVAIGLAMAVAASPSPAHAQTPYVPYFGKNQIRYDNFKWMTYETDHFVIYFYPEIQPHLERMAGYAESAYQHISTELKYDLGPEKVALILFQTSSEFQQQNVIPGAAQEGVGAFAEPTRKRILMPMDEPPDLLYRLMVHELTHQFEFEIIPTSLMRRNVPLWVNEGLSDYMTGYWRPLDLMSVRDAAVTDIVPKMSKLDEYGGFSSPRMIYNLGHAVFEFMEVQVGQGGAAPVSLRPPQVGDRRRRQRLPGSVQDRSRRLRPAVREVPEGPLQAVPRQGAAVGLRPQPGAQPREELVQQRALRRAVAVGRSDCRRHRQPQGPGSRHRPGLGQGRQRHPQPDQGLRPVERVRVPDHARRPLEHRAVDDVGAGGRPARLLRPHREVAHAHPAERRHAQDRGPVRPAHARRAGVAGHFGRRPARGLRRARGRRRRHLHARSADARGHQPDQGRLRRRRAHLVARRQVHRLRGARQRQREAVPSRHRHPQEDADHLRHPRRLGGAVRGSGHAHLLVHGHQPVAADRPGRGAQRRRSTTSGR